MLVSKQSQWHPPHHPHHLVFLFDARIMRWMVWAEPTGEGGMQSNPIDQTSFFNANCFTQNTTGFFLFLCHQIKWCARQDTLIESRVVLGVVQQTWQSRLKREGRRWRWSVLTYSLSTMKRLSEVGWARVWFVVATCRVWTENRSQRKHSDPVRAMLDLENT